MAGRPSKPASERRNYPLRIRVNDAERIAIETAAQTQSKKTSTWARELILLEARRLLDANKND